MRKKNHSLCQQHDLRAAPGRRSSAAGTPCQEASVLVPQGILGLWVRAEVSDCQPHWPQQCKRKVQGVLFSHTYILPLPTFLAAACQAFPTQDANELRLDSCPPWVVRDCGASLREYPTVKACKSKAASFPHCNGEKSKCLTLRECDPLR